MDCLRLLDGEGTYAHFPVSTNYYENPASHMEIFDIVRYAWNGLKNEELKNASKTKRRNKH